MRPCRKHLGEELHARWQAHLCGLCLTLREEAGQPERALTGYDVLLLSVLVEAQAGELPTTQAGPCPLRAFRPAQVVAATVPAARFAAAGALLTGSAGLDDKLADGEVPRGARGPATRASARLRRRGLALAERSGFDPAAVLDAPAAAQRAEAGPPDLGALLAPSGAAVAALFAHTAVLAGTPENAGALARAGDAFGRLVHLLDAAEDHAQDGRAGRFNPLTATGTAPDDAHRLALTLVDQVQAALAECRLRDPALVRVLLGHELSAAVRRVLGPPPAAVVPAVVPAQRQPGLAGLLALWVLLLQAVIVGSWGTGGGGCGPRRRRRAYDPYDPYAGRGYAVSTGPSCLQCLACNCCANIACNTCCCGGCGNA